MLQFIMLIGPSGCGKSTWAKEYVESLKDNYGKWDIHSSDAIRGELWGDENDQQNPSKVFEVLHHRVRQSLREGCNVIYDATNLSRKRRIGFLKTIHNWEVADHFKVENHAVVIVASEFECITRNQKRVRKVPIEVIERQFNQIQLPWFDEGWDKIKYEITDDFRPFWGDLLNSLDFPHHNNHHKYDVLEHSLRVAARLGEPFSDGWKLGILHDCGKPKTKTWTKPNGEHDGQAHYYNHHLVGGYMSLLYDEGHSWKKYLRAMTIQYHMEPWFRKDKIEEFYENLQDEGLVNMIKKLHEADREEA